ncbi:RNA polymerase sigma-70 factor [Olivibacter sp. SDN3]|uniref:RNA polymerase sigma-70 factor n=1 Tax=Olivibacter sp. SDN3 TaxID=2764720 RepID=UPI0016518A66|nr:RNA polymerase sigma-70 factor [Olivibacter sp. SDN3]QNL50470.1 RNA polymerase sigma-70 factor [Olivibacter sp. SDN3]
MGTDLFCKIRRSGAATSNEQHLLERIQHGDQHAFRTLFDRYQHRVFAFTLKIVKSRELAEEILYAVFLKIWQHKGLDQIENFESYIRVLTKNHTLNVLRSLNLAQKTSVEFAAHLQQHDNATEETILFGETSRLLAEAVEKLPPRQQLVYQLCHEEGLKYEQAAKQLAVSKLTVKTHMQLALRFIRKYLNAHTEIAFLILSMHLIWFR